MEQLPLGSVRVVVIADDGVVLNDPEHHSLGRIPLGQTAVTNEAYVPHLREQGLAIPVEELGELDIRDIRQQFADIGIPDDGDDEDGHGENEEPSTQGEGGVIPPVLPKGKGRPRTAAK